MTVFIIKMNVIIKAVDFEQFCRICFRSTSDMVSCFSKLVNGNGSCTVADILNILSPDEIVSCYKSSSVITAFFKLLI